MSDSTDITGFVAPEVADLAPHFPGYEITGLIATGGMGAVYCAVQKSLDRNVAIKILPPELSKDAAFRIGFEAEAKAMAKLNHPNLIGVFDFGDVGGMLYIIMEFVPGKSLYHSSYGIAIDPQEVIRLVTGICLGLAHAHDHAILHRDIKPSNILLDLHAEPKIGDFGLARPADWTIAEGEEIFGTPHYTAPEVVDSPHSVDHRADIFSVGVVLHELLTAKLPADDPRPASAIIRCDARFDAIIKKATQPLPFARYGSAKEMAAELQQIALTQRVKGPSANSPAAPHRPSRPAHPTVIRRQQKSSGSPVLLVVLGLAAVAGAVYFLNQPKPAPAPGKKASSVVVLPSPAPQPVKNPVESEPAPVDPVNPATDEIATEPAAPVTDPGEVTETTTEEPAAQESPTAVSTTEPKYDVAAFLGRARRVMTERAAPLVANHGRTVRQNFDDFNTALEREVRRVRGSVGDMTSELAKEQETWAEDGRVPKRLPSSLQAAPDAARIHSASHARQTGIDDRFHQELARLATTYVSGISTQSDRLKQEGDTGAVSLLQQEIQKTTRDANYFPELVGTPAADDE